MAAKEKTRTSRVPSKGDTSLPNKQMPGKWSQFGNLISDGRALIDLEGQVFTQKYLESHQGGVSTIDAVFSAEEARVVAARRGADVDPDRWILAAQDYNEAFLNVRRRAIAQELLDFCKPELHDFVKERSQKPLELPEVSHEP